MFDLVIIGAGVAGISTASYFATKYREWQILLIEKTSHHGRGISSRNSEVIHAGIYYPTNWLKSKLCLEGRKLLYPFLEKYSIPHKKTGKIIVAGNDQQETTIETIFSNAIKKNVDGLKLLTQDQVKTLEPDVQCKMGMYSSESGILSADRYMDVLLSLFKENGGYYLPETEFKSINNSGNKMNVTLHSKQDGESQIETKYLVNAAGLAATKISANAGMANVPNTHYCKGHYFKVHGARNSFSHLVYPVPDKTYLGTHVTIDLKGEIKLGPDAVYLEKNCEDYSEFLSEKSSFIESVKEFWPNVINYQVEEDMIGIRPKLYSGDMDAKDFIIRDEAEAGYPNWISMYGIESPGLTASMAFGPYIDQEFLSNTK